MFACLAVYQLPVASYCSSQDFIFTFTLSTSLCRVPRNLLLRFGHFGTDGVSVSTKLARAYKKFKDFIAAHKIECSQPQFSEKMETWTYITYFIIDIIYNNI